MPMYKFVCDLGHTTKRIMTVEAFEECEGFVHCGQDTCSAVGRHRPLPPSSQTMEVVDNGIQTRPVERLAEAERIFKEREYAHDQKYKIVDPEE